MPISEEAAFFALIQSSLLSFGKKMLPIVHTGSAFDSADYLRLLVDRLEQVRAGKIRRIIINMPPQTLKSFLATVCFIAFLLGHNPRLRLLIVSHSKAVACAHLNDIRKILKSEVYQGAFRKTRIGGKDSEVEFHTTAGGRVLAAPLSDIPTGRGFDGIVVDDPLIASDAGNSELLEKCFEQFRGPLRSRLKHAVESFIVIVMQRLAAGDLTGRLLELSKRARDDGENAGARGASLPDGASEAGDSCAREGDTIPYFYHHLSLPLLATEDEELSYGDGEVFQRKTGAVLNPRRFTDTAIASIKTDMTDQQFAAYYQQQPLVPGGTLVKREWFAFFDARSARGVVLQAWDTAASLAKSAAYSVCVTAQVKDKKIEVLDVFRDRVDEDKLVKQGQRLVHQFKPRVVLIEDASTGGMLRHELKKLPGLAVETIFSSSSKIDRFTCCRPVFRDLGILFPRNAPWLQEYMNELLAFPHGRYDDQVDATTLLVQYLLPRLSGEIKDRLLGRPECITTSVNTSGPGVARIGRSAVPVAGYIDPRQRPHPNKRWRSRRR